MSTPSVPNIQQRLEKLNPTDASYRTLLFQLLVHQDLKPHVQDLQESDLEGFVEFLDRVSVADASSDIHLVDLAQSGAQPHPRNRRSFSEDLTEAPEYLQQPWGPATIPHHSERDAFERGSNCGRRFCQRARGGTRWGKGLCQGFEIVRSGH